MPVLPRFDLRALATDALRFARAYPAIAGQLARPATDPATERLVEGSQYLAGTVLDKIEDFQDEAHERLAQRVSPWLRRPIPAATVVALDPARGASLVVPVSTELTCAGPGGMSCTFRLTGPARVGGFGVRTAGLETRAGQAPILRIELESTSELPINETVSEGVSLYIDGELENALAIVHLLTAQLASVAVSCAEWNESVSLAPANVQRGGLRPDEALAPDPDGPASAFGVFTEAMIFPHRFRFVHLDGLAACAQRRATSSLTLTFVLRGPLSAHLHFGADHVRTSCATVTNLFTAAADPVVLDTERGPIPLRVAGISPRAASVYAVRNACATASHGGRGPQPLPDLRRLNAARRESESPAAFATALARAADGETLTTIAFSRLGTSCEHPHTVSAALLATNAARAGRLRSGEVSGTVEIGGVETRFVSVVPSSPHVAPPLGDAFTRRAVRLAALPGGRRELLGGLRDALSLAVPSWSGSTEETQAMHQKLEGLRSLEVAVARRRVGERATQHGYAYNLTVDESAFRGPGDMGLIGAVVGEALGRCAPVSTFAELTLVGARTGSRTVYAASRTL
jgi:type VI secretion system protein ImpG